MRHTGQKMSTTIDEHRSEGGEGGTSGSNDIVERFFGRKALSVSMFERLR